MCLAEILTAVLFESCIASNFSDRERINKIVPIITTKGFDYIPNSYLNAYFHVQKTLPGENFKKMLKLGGDVFGD